MQFVAPPSTLLFLHLHANLIALLFQYFGLLPPRSPIYYVYEGAYKAPPKIRSVEKLIGGRPC